MSFATVIRTARTASLSIGLRPAVTHGARLSHNQASASTSTVPSEPAAQMSIPPSNTEKREDIGSQEPEIRIISYDEFLPKTQRATDERSTIIDVREPAEVAEGIIPSAIHIPLAIVGDELQLPAAQFLEKYGVEKPQPNEEVVFYCRSGRRSTLACDVAKVQGYTNIVNYKGSWLDWEEKQKAKASP